MAVITGATVTAEQMMNNIREVFFPSAKRELDRVRSNNGLRFAHYTSADVALSIIRNKQMWLRNSKTMNDLSEVSHGLRSLALAYDRDSTNELKQVLDELHPTVQKEIEDFFVGHQPNFLHNTYLTCVSEHSPSEYPNGRLSMWRAYAPINGVALVLNTHVFGTSSDVLKSYSTPVHYGDEDTIAVELALIGRRMREEIAFLRTFQRAHLHSVIFNMLHFFGSFVEFTVNFS